MDLDETSVAIGTLTAEVKSLNENQDRLITFIMGSTQRVENALIKHADEDERNFKSLSEKVGDLNQFKTRVYTIASVCAFICTGLVNVAYAIITKTKNGL